MTVEFVGFEVISRDPEFLTIPPVRNLNRPCKGNGVGGTTGRRVIKRLTEVAVVLDRRGNPR